MRLTLSLLVAGVLACGCGWHGQGSNAGILRYPMATKPTSLDPATVQDGDSISIVDQVFEGLVRWNQDNRIEPCAADRWQVSQDGRTYTFHLRPGLRFFDGQPVVAQDFKDAWERNCRSGLASPTARRYLNDIVGVREVIAGESSHISGLNAIDRTRFSVTINRPLAYFLEKLTVPVAAVYEANAVKDPDEPMTKPAEMIGSGAFKVTQTNFGQMVELEANPLYWDGPSTLGKIQRPYVPDSSTRLTLYKSGYLNYLRLELQDVKGIQSDRKLGPQLQFSPRPAIWYFGINCGLARQFSEPRVRRAMAMAVDRHRISNEILEGVNPEANCIIPPGVFAHRSAAQALPFDPVQARRLLAESGYPNGKGLPEITIWYRNNRPDMQLVAEAVGLDLSKNLNLRVACKATEYAWLLVAGNKRQVPFIATRWSADYLDAEDFLSGLLCSDATGNTLQFHNAEFDSLCAKADHSNNLEERLTLYARAEDIALRDAPMIPICFEQDAELVSPKVHGIRKTLVGHMPHSKVTVE